MVPEGAPTREARHDAELLELGDAFFELDRSWRILRVNGRQERLSRKPRAETVGRTFAEVWPDLVEPPSRYLLEYQRCMAERVPVQFQDYYAPLDLWTGVTAYPVSHGGIAVFFRDISAYKKVELEATRQAAEREAVVASVADGVVVYDAEGRILRTNAAADAILDYRPEQKALPVAERLEAARMAWTTEDGGLVGPEDMPAIRAALHGETVRDRVLRMRRPGRERWIRISAAPLLVGGERSGAVAILSDITGQHEQEEALRASEARLRRMIDANPIGVLTRDDTGRIRYANDAYLRMVHATRAELEAGRVRWDELTAPEHLARDRASMRQAQARGVSDVFEKDYVLRDGTRVPVLVAMAAMGTPGVLTSFVVDITERKRAEERLRDADRRKDEFLGMLSHELRNPLAPIRNALYILERADPATSQARRALEVARRQVAHMTRLVDDLLDVTRIARAKIELRRTEVDLGAVAQRGADDHRPLMKARGVELEVELRDAPVIVHGDETRLAQVLGNLLHNASKFTRPGGRVVVRVERDGGRGVLQVRDTGVGMDPSTLETVFEPFVQGRQTLARSEGGLGLGLALVKGLVALHGGDVVAHSGGPGQGAEFVVTIPLDRRRRVRSRPAAPGAEAAAGSRHRRVLVVDDNRDAAETLAELLELGGHEVLVAHDGPTALALARVKSPEVVLCDIGLPGMDGYEVARQLRADGTRDVRLVAVSGYAQPEDVARATEAGFDAHVAKPPDPDRLARLLH